MQPKISAYEYSQRDVDDFRNKNCKPNRSYIDRCCTHVRRLDTGRCNMDHSLVVAMYRQRIFKSRMGDAVNTV